MRNIYAALGVLLLVGCEMGPLDSVTIVDYRYMETEVAAGEDYPLSYTITVEYNLTLFKGELVLLFNTGKPDVFVETGIFNYNEDNPPHKIVADKGTGRCVFTVAVMKPAWEAQEGAWKAEVRLNKQFASEEFTLCSDTIEIEHPGSSIPPQDKETPEKTDEAAGY